MGYATDVKNALNQVTTAIEAITNFSTLFTGGVKRGNYMHNTGANYPYIFITTVEDSQVAEGYKTTINQVLIDIFIVVSQNVDDKDPTATENTQVDRVGDVIDKLESDRTLSSKVRNLEVLGTAYNEDDNLAFPHTRTRVMLELERAV